MAEAEKLNKTTGWMRQLAETPPDWALGEAKIGEYRFTTVEAYYAMIEAASKVFGPMGVGWAILPHPGYPRKEEWIDKKGRTRREAVCAADFHYIVPETNEPARWPVVVVGQAKVVHSLGDAMKGAITNGIGKALSYLGFAYKIYSGQYVKGGQKGVGHSIDTHLSHYENGEDGWDGPPAEAPPRDATPPPERSDRRSASSSGGGQARGGRRGPPPGWVACEECGKKCKPMCNNYGPFIKCRDCDRFQNLTRAEAELAVQEGILDAEALAILTQNEGRYGDRR